MNYYNENDPKAAALLRELIKAGIIPDGRVDERSIVDVRAGDLEGYTHCHFFAGIGGWAHALRLAGWPEDRPIWTGSCPCQPFSCAGKGKGVDDARHLWPVFRELIRAGQPPEVTGEQVASAAGREWLAGVFADLEGMGYRKAGADLCAASVGAPHIRQRLYWVADAERSQRRPQLQGHEFNGDDAGWDKAASRVGACCETGRLADAASGGLGIDGSAPRDAGYADQCGEAGRVGDTAKQGLERSKSEFQQPEQAERRLSTRSSDAGAWSDFDVIQCLDGKARRIESGSFPLAHGVPARVVRLRGYGNAIVPQVAAEFIKAYLEIT